MFLRNHDELTLEMVTDEERDYMWRVYANDPTARINLGIRRRLAPLLDGDPLWYKDAVIYQLHPRAFFDSVTASIDNRMR